ncbi:hypothetical protein BGLY_3080 [Bacillus glycinifermentans]|nr:hypothetical protein BGLY_3080 [Bacillus glycinifermentans]
MKDIWGARRWEARFAIYLFGDANPSGKLAETFPKRLHDNPSYLNFPGEGDRVEYREGLFVGYRYYDSKNLEPLFPFGYGLSYTSFEYTGLSIDKRKLRDTEKLTVAVNVKNVGDAVGKEIVQLYVRDRESTVIRPEKELRGFEKITLQPGEEKTVTFELDKRAFAYYNTELKNWHVEAGTFGILIGKSSSDIVLEETVEVESTVNMIKPFHRNTLAGDLMEDPVTAPVISRFLAKLGESNGGGQAEQDNAEMIEAIIKYSPLRAFVSYSNGSITDQMIEELLIELNDLKASSLDQSAK